MVSFETCQHRHYRSLELRKLGELLQVLKHLSALIRVFVCSFSQLLDPGVVQQLLGRVPVINVSLKAALHEFNGILTFAFEALPIVTDWDCHDLMLYLLLSLSVVWTLT